MKFELLYQTSDTVLKAEWLQDQIWKDHWYCSNCHNTHVADHTMSLTPYCSKCGFKMKNPRLIKVEYEYE